MESFQDLALSVKRSSLAMCRMSPVVDLTGHYFTKLMLEKGVKAIVYSSFFLEMPTTECIGSGFNCTNVLLASVLYHMFETELEREADYFLHLLRKTLC